jgi:hypothetical protein
VLNGRNAYGGGRAQFCFDFTVKYNRHGNIEVITPSVRQTPDFVSFLPLGKYVFNRAGVCISHPPSKRYSYHEVNAKLVKAFE